MFGSTTLSSRSAMPIADDTTDELTAGRQWINHLARRKGADITRDTHFSEFGIDPHFGEMRAKCILGILGRCSIGSSARGHLHGWQIVTGENFLDRVGG